MGKTYCIDLIASSIDNHELTGSKVYGDTEDFILDVTMSCDKEERINWMLHFMADALRNTGGYNQKLRAQFLVAYKLYVGMTGNRNTYLTV